MSICAAESVDLRYRIHRVYQRLATAASLEPSEEVNDLFGELVRVSLSGSEENIGLVLGDPIVNAIKENLRLVCARGEYALERHWAECVITSRNAWDRLREFPYYDNYEKLARLEINGLRGVREIPVRRALFIGSGPLPLTSIVLAASFGASVDNVDLDENACHLGGKLAEVLGLRDRLRFFHANALQLTDLVEYDVIFLAALVGLRAVDKQRVIRHVGDHTSAKAFLIARSARHLKTLLYPEIKDSQLAPFMPLIEIHPHHEVINSVIIAHKALSAHERLRMQAR